MKEVHLGITKSSELIIPHLRKCMIIDDKQTTNEPKIEKWRWWRGREIVVNSEHLYIYLCGGVNNNTWRQVAYKYKIDDFRLLK